MQNRQSGSIILKISSVVLKTNKGFTLIEALIAVSVFAIGFLAIGSLVISTTRNTTKGNIITQATMLATHKMEELKDQQLMSTVMTTGTPHTDPNNPLNQYGQNGGIFNRSWTVSETSPTAREVEVTVSWNRLGKTRRVQLKTITRGNGT
jgi:prepilin-type N-terminal cleavage/methylation domain-containing protein